MLSLIHIFYAFRAVKVHGNQGFFRMVGRQVDKVILFLSLIHIFPSLPVIIQLIKICGLPVERYFNPEIMREESAQRQRVSHKLKLCPEQYLPIIEGAIDGALKMEQTANQKEDA